MAKPGSPNQGLRGAYPNQGWEGGLSEPGLEVCGLYEQGSGVGVGVSETGSGGGVMSYGSNGYQSRKEGLFKQRSRRGLILTRIGLTITRVRWGGLDVE